MATLTAFSSLPAALRQGACTLLWCVALVGGAAHANAPVPEGPLVSTEWLAANLNRADVRIVDDQGRLLQWRQQPNRGLRPQRIDAFEIGFLGDKNLETVRAMIQRPPGVEVLYLPTFEQQKLGGYETWRARSSHLETEASTVITRNLKEMLAEVAR